MNGLQLAGGPDGLAARVIREHRAAFIAIGIGLLANILLYAFVVYPLANRSADAANRAERAAMARQAAEKDLAGADALVKGKSIADQELDQFYTRVLPADLVAAQRATYGPIPELARQHNVTFLRRTYSPEVVQDALTTRLSTRAEFVGEYEDLREFIYALETAPTFVIIDDIALASASNDDRLTLSLGLSTYFRTPGAPAAERNGR
jgi:Tfp pilus assembly protein PilO